MQRTKPSDYLAGVKAKLLLMRTRTVQEADYDPSAGLRATFPLLAAHASCHSFPPRVKTQEGYGVESFILFLASECDGAITRDDRGFSQADALEGHRLAAKLAPSSRLALTLAERDWAFDRCMKYRDQLVNRYNLDYAGVMLTSKFLFPPAPEEQAAFVQHIRYNEDARSISFSLPSVADGKLKEALTSEVWNLVRATNLSLTPSLSVMTKRVRRNWERNRDGFTFLQTEPGARDFVDILQKLGYTKDERIDAALNSDAKAYIRVRPETGPGYDGKHLVCSLYRIVPNEALRQEIIDLFESFGRDDIKAHDAVNLSKKHKYPVQRFFVGEAVIDDLEAIMMRHGVQNYGSARLALDDPKRRTFQHPALNEFTQVSTIASEANGLRLR